MPTVLRELTGVEASSEKYMGLHVAAKIFVPFSLSLSILFTKDPYSAIILVLISLSICLVAGIPLSLLKRYLVVIGSMTSFIALSFVLFTHIPGKTIYEATILSFQAEKGVFEWKISVTDRGLLYIAIFTSRIFAMIFSALLLLGTVTDRDIIWGLRSIGLPFGVCVAVSLFFRGIQLFVSDFYTVREAMMARGVDFAKTSLAKKFLLYVNALIPILSLMITRSFEVSMALEARGIAPGTKTSTIYHTYKMGRRDYIVVAFSTLLVAIYAGWYLWPAW